MFRISNFYHQNFRKKNADLINSNGRKFCGTKSCEKYCGIIQLRINSFHINQFSH